MKNRPGTPARGNENRKTMRGFNKPPQLPDTSQGLSVCPFVPFSLAKTTDSTTAAHKTNKAVFPIRHHAAISAMKIGQMYVASTRNCSSPAAEWSLREEVYARLQEFDGYLT